VLDERWTGPDLSGYSVTDRAAYEWYLSDHPWARTERLRRAEADCAGAVARAAEVRAGIRSRRPHCAGCRRRCVRSRTGRNCARCWMPPSPTTSG
jgi:hypothetical protein